jgi:hypothetical protein
LVNPDFSITLSSRDRKVPWMQAQRVFGCGSYIVDPMAIFLGRYKDPRGLAAAKITGYSGKDRASLARNGAVSTEILITMTHCGKKGKIAIMRKWSQRDRTEND